MRRRTWRCCFGRDTIAPDRWHGYCSSGIYPLKVLHKRRMFGCGRWKGGLCGQRQSLTRRRSRKSRSCGGYRKRLSDGVFFASVDHGLGLWIVFFMGSREMIRWEARFIVSTLVENGCSQSTCLFASIDMIACSTCSVVKNAMTTACRHSCIERHRRIYIA